LLLVSYVIEERVIFSVNHSTKPKLLLKNER